MDWADRFIAKTHELRSYIPINAPHQAERPMGRGMIKALSEFGNCSYVLDEINLTVTFVYEKDE